MCAFCAEALDHPLQGRQGGEMDFSPHVIFCKCFHWYNIFVNIKKKLK
jgi:hypothetical protein